MHSINSFSPGKAAAPALVLTLLSMAAAASADWCTASGVPQTIECLCTGNTVGSYSRREKSDSSGQFCGYETTSCDCRGAMPRAGIPWPTQPSAPATAPDPKWDILEVNDYYDNTWTVPNRSLGIVQIAPSATSRDIRIQCDTLSTAPRRGLSDEKWILLKIYGAGINYRSNMEKIDNATRIDSPTLSGSVGSQGGRVYIEKSDHRATSNHLKCVVGVSVR